MDNASYHSKMINPQPTSSWKKADLMIWLEERNISFKVKDKNKTLLQKCQAHKEKIRYEMDELLANTDHQILRLPPYHCCYNPIELVWGITKRYFDKHIGRDNDFSEANMFKIWNEALDKVDPEVWKKCCQKIEKKILEDCSRELDNPKFIEEVKSRSVKVIDGESDESDDGQWKNVSDEEMEFSDFNAADIIPELREMEVTSQETIKMNTESPQVSSIYSCKRSLLSEFSKEKLQVDKPFSPPLPEISQKETNSAVHAITDELKVIEISPLDDYKNCLGSDDTLIQTKIKISIYVRDLKTLYPPAWLNDQVINVYFEMIAERGSPSIYACNTYFFQQLTVTGFKGVQSWTKNVRIFSKRLMIIPIHLGAHWCLAVINFEETSITYFDSYNGKNVACLEALMDYLCKEHEVREKKPLNRASWKMKHAKGIPRQTNSYDCGVFVCAYAEHISRDEPFNFSKDDMVQIRGQILDEIITNKLYFSALRKRQKKEMKFED